MFHLRVNIVLELASGSLYNAVRWILSESEPRVFISFRLGKENNGQPTSDIEEQNDIWFLVRVAFVSISDTRLNYRDMDVTSVEHKQLFEFWPLIRVDPQRVMAFVLVNGNILLIEISLRYRKL